jgi:hypothetical protein
MANFLTAKVGPLPAWGWMAVATVGVVGYLMYRSRKQASQSQQVQQAAQLAATQAASTAAAAPYQPYTVPYVASAASYGSSATYGNGYDGHRRHPHGQPQAPQPPAPASTADAYQPAMMGPGWSPDTPAQPVAPQGGTRDLGRGIRILGGPGHYKLFNRGTVNPFGSGITNLSQADSYAQQFGAP